MPSILTRLLLFVSSYFPLSLIFFALFIHRRPWIAISILSIGTLGLVGLALYLRVASRLSAIRVQVTDFKQRDGDSMSYIVSYVIPFLAVPFNGFAEGVALSIFFIVLGLLYVNSNMIQINPMLNLGGYHTYEITLDDGTIHALITNRRISRGAVLSVIKAGDDILLEKSNDSHKKEPQ